LFLKNKKADIKPLQPPTLAAFLPWGSSEGAGYVSRRKGKHSFILGNTIQLKLLKLF